MSEINLEMGKKRSRQQQSNIPVAAVDSSESGDGAPDKNSPNKQNCPHVAKSIDANQIKKNINLCLNGKKTCAHCKEGNEEDNKNVEGNDDFWVCLRCGARSCTLEHSSLHYDVPRSDSHALSLRIPAFMVWCHACKADIPSGYSKKLKTCVGSVDQLYNKQINLQPLPQQETKHSSKSKDENGDNKETKLNDPIPLPPPKSAAPSIAKTTVRGLTNLGNTCFFNSVLQCLAQTPGLVEAIREMETPDQHVNIVLKSGASLDGKLGQWDSLSECLADTLVKLKSGGPVVSPDRLLSLLTKKQTQFQGYRQHDAHELLTYLLDSVRMADHKRYRKLILSHLGLYGKQEYQDVPEETMKNLKALDHEIAEIITFAPEKVFKGRLVNRIECQECKSVKTFEESFLDLSLPIVPDKPQPPCMRRKGGHQQYLQNQSQLEPVQEENKSASGNGTSEQTMSKSQLRKEKRLQKKKIRKLGKNICAENMKKEEGEDSSPFSTENNVIEDAKGTEEQQQESDVEGDVEDNSEETNCGSKPSNFQKNVDIPREGDIELSDVNCGNQGVWLDSNESNSSSVAEKEKSMKLDSSCQQEEESHIISYLLGMEESRGTHLDDNSPDSKKPCIEEDASASLYLQDNNLNGQVNECSSEQMNNCEDQVTAWLNKSNLINVPDPEIETDREIYPPFSHNTTETSGCAVVISSRLSPKTQTSVVSSNHPSSQPSFDETRSSFLTGTQETQESGYCSEKLGCLESPHREDSPCSLDGLSPAWSGVEGALSSRSDVSIEEVFNNASVAIAEEDESTETNEVAPSSLLDFPPPDNCQHSACMGKGQEDLYRRCLEQDPSLQDADSTSAIESVNLCTLWLEESARVPSYEEKSEGPTDAPLKGKGKRNKKIGNTLGGIYYVRELGDIPEEEGDIAYGPLNRDQIGDVEGSDSNSNGLSTAAQGLIARPGSPFEECNNDTSDLKHLEINDLNVGNNHPAYLADDEVDNKKVDEVAKDKVSELVNVRNASGDKESSDLSCGCNNRIQRQESADICCLHTSLAQSTQAELMTGCNKIVCDTCSSGSSDGKSVYTNSTKQTLVSQAPPALVIHLKRFQVQMMTCRKLSRHVSFPIQLDLTPYSVPTIHHSQEEHKKSDDENNDANKPNLLYTLYGVVEHSGTMNGGHYVAYVKITRDSSSWWYCISDSHVSQVSENKVLSAQAYLLFYKRITT